MGLHDPFRFPGAEAFAAAAPFPHAVIDGLWDPNLLAAARAEFPHPDDPRWVQYGDARERGKRAGGPAMWGMVTREFFDYAASPGFVRDLEVVTGIRGLTADHLGGGMHLTGPGGRLGMHRDFLTHPSRPLRRRINVLVYLADTWDCAWGGCLHLGRPEDGPTIAVAPTFNRTVIFATSETSWHGHPVPIVGDHWRPSLATYFYTAADPDQPADSTVFCGGDGSDQP